MLQSLEQVTRVLASWDSMPLAPSLSLSTAGEAQLIPENDAKTLATASQTDGHATANTQASCL